MRSGLEYAFRKYQTFVKGLNGLFTFLAAFLVLIIILVVIFSIVGRSMGLSVSWANDVAQIAFIYVAFLSFAPALQAGSHVQVELFERFVPSFLRTYLDHIAAIACIIFGTVLLIQLWRLTGRSFADGRLMIASITFPLKWVQLAGPIGVAQFVMTAVMILGRAQLQLLKGNDHKIGAM